MARLAVVAAAPVAVLALSTVAGGNESAPALIAERVADRLVANTEFVLKKRAMDPVQQGYAVVHLPGGEEDVTWLAHTQLAAKKPDGVTTLQISHSAAVVDILADADVVLESALSTDGAVRKVDYGYVVGDARTDVPIPAGSRSLTLRIEPKNANAAWFALGATGANGQESTAAHAFTSPIGAEHPFIVRKLSGADVDNLVAGEGSEKVQDGWWVPAVPVVHAIAEPLDYSDWRYFTGTALTAMADVSDHFDGLDYNDYIDAHVQFFLKNVDKVAAERIRHHLIGSAFGHYFRFMLLDDVGPQSAALARWAASAPPSDTRERARYIIERAARQVMDGVRLDDGTFARVTPFDKSVWADDLFMGGLSLVTLSEFLGEPALLNEAATQALLIDKHLKDTESGLYWHGYFADRDAVSSSKWGRANGWTMMAKTEILQALPADHHLRGPVLETFQDHAHALLKVQSDDGRWHQVLDRPNTYLETSSTAMFVRAFATGVAEGWLPAESFADAAESGWKALTSQIDEEGKVEGIVRGTPIFFSDEEYNEHLPRTDDPRGLGAILYAAIAVDRMRKTLN